MTIQEVHVHLDLICQELNSNIYRNLLPEEKDIILDKAQIRFIREVTTPESNKLQQGFEYTQGRYDDIEELLETKVLPSYRFNGGGDLNESVFSILPVNYLRLTRIRSRVKDLCGVSYIDTVTTVNEDINYILFELDDDASIGNKFNVFTIVLNGTNLGSQTIFNIENYSNYSAGLSSNEEKFILVRLILDKVNEYFKDNQIDYSLYWESFDRLFKPNQFILVVDDDIIDLDVTIGEDITTYSPDTLTFAKITNDLTEDLVSTHRLVKSNDIWKMLETSFHTTIPRSPLSEIENSRLISYHQKKFIIGDTIIQYVRKPKIIDINLNQGFEVNPNVHDKVIDIAARMISSYTNAGTQKQVMMESLLKE